MNPSKSKQLGPFLLSENLADLGDVSLVAAEHSKLGRKVTLAIHEGAPEGAKEFALRARAVAQIEHESLVEITDVVDGSPSEPTYLVMEAPRGRPLSDEIGSKEGLSLSRALGIAVQLTTAAEALLVSGCGDCRMSSETIVLRERGGQRDVIALFFAGHEEVKAEGSVTTILRELFGHVEQTRGAGVSHQELETLLSELEAWEKPTASDYAALREKLIGLAEKGSVELERFVRLPGGETSRNMLIAAVALAIIIVAGVVFFLSFDSGLTEDRGSHDRAELDARSR